MISTIDTPAIVYDQRILEATLDDALAAQTASEFKLLYSVKAAGASAIIQFLAPQLDGFASSSLFEALLVRDLSPNSNVHFTSPGIPPSAISALGEVCQYIAFNSRTQCERFGPKLASAASLGLRANTRISSVGDPRYDPCGKGSKLGIPAEELAVAFDTSSVRVDGLHIHTNADSRDFGQLLANVRALAGALPDKIKLRWVNLGGGYLFDRAPLGPLVEAVMLVKERFGAEVFMEPGAGLVRDAGFLIASVLDIFEVDGARIAVLDTTVNHLPEVFEFGYEPEVVGTIEDGPFEYTLAGTSCLAGDKFGTYRFLDPLEIGGRVVFAEAGAYALSKAHRFNGINLPTVHFLGREGNLIGGKTFTYRDFKSYWTMNG